MFEAFVDRTQDWADLEETHAAGTFDAALLVGALTLLLGADDHRLAQLLAIVAV